MLKHALPAILALALSAISPIASAQTHDHSGHQHTAKTDAQPTTPMTRAIVRKIDRNTGKITLQHGEIPNLSMPPMTMVFATTDPKQLSPLAVGDAVQFRADSLRGQITLTHIEKVTAETQTQ